MEPFGALRTFGLHKGYGLAVVCELLGAALSGGETVQPATQLPVNGVWNNMLAIVFDPARLGTGQWFETQAREFIEWVRSAPPSSDNPEGLVRVPGDPERVYASMGNYLFSRQSLLDARRDQLANYMELALSAVEPALARGEPERAKDLLRALRFEARFVIFAGIAAAAGWVALMAFLYVAVAWAQLGTAQLVLMVFVFTRLLPRIGAIQTTWQIILNHLPAFTAVEKLRTELLAARDRRHECAVLHEERVRHAPARERARDVEPQRLLHAGPGGARVEALVGGRRVVGRIAQHEHVGDAAHEGQHLRIAIGRLLGE